MKHLLSLAVILAAGSAAAQAPARGARYVSMGSSYAAGPGVGKPDPAGTSCQRSSSNYARLVAARRQLTLVDVSCSSAVTDNILAHGQHGLPAQIEAVTPETQFVSDLIGLSCRDTGGVNCHVADPATVRRKMAALPSSLDRVIAEIRRRAPQARIVLVGYLPAIPSSGSGTCASLPLTPADAGRVRGVALRLAQIIGGAAARNGVGIVRASVIGVGHDVCSSSAYLAGFQPARNPGWSSAVAYHPTQAGMNAVAEALNAQLRCAWRRGLSLYEFWLLFDLCLS